MTAASQRQDGSRPSLGDVRPYLESLLANVAFKASARRRRLLKYVVEQTLAGRGERLKGFDLAVSVLGRDERFDAQNDPIVRIEIARLRRDLEHYYFTEGRDDPIRITIPKGRYIPAFEARDQASMQELVAAKPAAARSRWLRQLGWPAGIIAGLLFALLLTAGVLRWAPWPAGDQPQQTGPAVVVLTFEPLGGGDGGQLLASGLTAGLIAELMRFDGIQVFTGLPAGQGGEDLPPAATGTLAYVVAGTVEREPSRVRVTARLTDRSSGEVLWSERYDRALTTTEIFDVQAELSGAIVGRLAQVYGVITQAAARQLRRTRPETLFAYDCVQRAFAFRRTFAMELYWPVRTCLEEAVRRDAGYAGAWAMLAFAHMDAARYELVEPAARAGELKAGLDAAQRAVELAPGSVPGLQSLAALRYATGEFDEAERVQRQAIALNPNNPESLAQLGWRLMARGRWDEGRTLLQDAIARSVVVPSWYHQTLALSLYLGGDLERARDAAELGKNDCCGHGYATLALTEAAIGHYEAASRALKEAMRQSPLLVRDPVTFWANFQGSDDVIDRLNAGLAKAGLAAARAAPTIP